MLSSHSCSRAFTRTPRRATSLLPSRHLRAAPRRSPYEQRHRIDRSDARATPEVAIRRDAIATGPRRVARRRRRRLEPAPRRARLRLHSNVAAGRRRDDGSTRPALPLRAERRRRAPQAAISGRGAAARGQGVARLRALARRGRRLRRAGGLQGRVLVPASSALEGT